MIILSILLSCGFWYISNKLPEYEYRLPKMLLKITSLITLIDTYLDIDPISPQYYKYFVLVFYLLGDLIIVWNELISVPFFIIGHLICILSHMIHLPWLILLCILISPTLLLISMIVYIILDEPDVIYLAYTYILGVILIITTVNGYYGYILMIISDIIIISRISSVQFLTWPLYYISIYTFINYHYL